MDQGSRSLSPAKASNAIPQELEGSRQSPHQSTGKSQIEEATPRPSLQRQGSPQFGLQTHNACESIRRTTNKPPNPDSEHSDVESYSYCSSSRSWSPSSLSHTPRTHGWPASFPASPHDCVLEKLGPEQDRRTATDRLNNTPAGSPRKSWFSSDRSVMSRLTACCFLACLRAPNVRKRSPPQHQIFQNQDEHQTMPSLPVSEGVPSARRNTSSRHTERDTINECQLLVRGSGRSPQVRGAYIISSNFMMRSQP